MGACVRVERNFFNTVSTAVMMVYSPEKGSVELVDNYFVKSAYSTTPSCILDIPYEYVTQLDETMDIPFLIASDVVGIEDNSNQLREFKLLTYPNPFNPISVISWQLTASSHVDLGIYNILGQRVITLVNKKQIPGIYEVKWDASDFPSGVYMCRLKAGDYVKSNKMILLK